jgi:hypothetical protein
MAYVGNPIDTQNTFQSLVGKRFNGDGSTTDFTLDVAPGSTLDIEVFVGNVRQDPNSAYTLSGTTLSFTGAPPSGTNNVYVVHQAKSVGTIDPPATETIAKTFSGNVTMSGTNTLSGTTTVSGALTASGGATISGTTPTLTVGDAGAEDAKIVFDGNAQDFHIGLDDSADKLVIGKGSALGTTTSMTFDENGIINKPLQPCFFAYKSNQTISSTGTHDITFGSERFDLNGDFSSNTFTAPVDGKYAFLCTVGYTNANAGGNVSIYLQVSNAEMRAHRQDSDSNTDTYETAPIATVIDMDANDTCKLQINTSVDTDFIVDGTTYRSYFSGYLVA